MDHSFLTRGNEVAVLGAGASGLTAAIFAAEAGLSVILLEGSARPGAKILVSGGGRCNVTHSRMTPEDFHGGPRPLIRNVLQSFDERKTLLWMKRLEIETREDETGKWFPSTNRARTVLDGLLKRIADLGIEIRTEFRVVDIRKAGDLFELIEGSGETLRVGKLIVAAGGCALPASGSNGGLFEVLERLGHRVIAPVPALVPLLVGDAGVPGLQGLSLEGRLCLRHPGGKILAEETGNILFTHFGISGPGALDFSRHYTRARFDNPEAAFEVTLGHPSFRRFEEADAWLKEKAGLNPGAALVGVLRECFPERYARYLVSRLPMEKHTGLRISDLRREARLHLAKDAAGLPLPVTGDRGFEHAKTTSGGVDLREITVQDMQSRKVPGLYLCGEVLDVDGREGGYNLQWAWATGYLAGIGAGGR